MYHGPREHVAEFFAQQGFVCPPRKGAADFLQEVTSSKDQEVWRQPVMPLVPSSPAASVLTSARRTQLQLADSV